METFELRYFLAVARHQNIHTASRQIAISAAALSKAVGRLEAELGVKLFSRLGRNISLTDQGKVLQARAAEIIQLEQSTRLEIQGHGGRLNISIAGPEIVLASLGFEIVVGLRKKYPNSSFEFHSAQDEEALAMVSQGSAHLALTTLKAPGNITAKTIRTCIFKTIVGRKHPLYGAARSGKSVPVDQLLLHPFVCPVSGILGRIQNEQSADGWREDLFPRRIEYVTSSLNLIESIVTAGLGVAYLPDYLVDKMDALPLIVSGCPYTCKQVIQLLAKKPETVSWMRSLF